MNQSGIQHIFVYGTLFPGQPNFKLIEQKVSSPQQASTRGALIWHMETGKEFPFLLYDRLSLTKLKEKTGIEPHAVHGTLYKIDDPTFFGELDLIETIVRTELELFTGEPSPAGVTAKPYSNLYVREVIKASVGGRPYLAYAYIANKDKSHTDRLIERPATKIVIPEGNWRRYLSERKETSLTIDMPKQATFGIETEIALLATNHEGEEIPLPKLADKGGYRIIPKGKERAIRFKTLGSLLAQTLYGSLGKDGLGSGVREYYYDRKARWNRRFPIPRGFSYVEGELVEPDGTDVGVRMIPSHDRGDNLCELESIGSRTVGIKLHRDDMFFEIAGFPSTVEQGFSEGSAVDELIRRFHLAKALEDIAAVRHKREIFDQIKLIGHSSQYNIILDPIFGGVDLSQAAVSAKVADNPQTFNVSKYTYDIAYVLGQTFGPLLSFILSGREPTYVEYKARRNNRLEYRNSVLITPEQLSAGIAVYVAAARTVEEKLKETLLISVERELMKPKLELTADDIINYYATMDPDMIVSAFQLRFTSASYQPSRFRVGFLISPENSYHGAVYDGLDILFTEDGEAKKDSLGTIVEKLFYDKDFNQNLASITTLPEYGRILKFIQGNDPVESGRNVSRRITSSATKRRIEEFTRHELGELYENGSTYPEVCSRFLFHQHGKMVFIDQNHQLTFQLDKSPDRSESDLYINSLPLEIILELAGKQGLPVSSFRARITPGNSKKLRSAIDQARIAQRPLWEFFFGLK